MKRSTSLLTQDCTVTRLAPSRATGHVSHATRLNATIRRLCEQITYRRRILCNPRLYAIVLLCAAPLRAADPTLPHELVAQANKALAQGDTTKALHLYDEAGKLLSDSPEIAYNQGIAQYRKGDYEKATELFTKALATRDLALDAKTRFNLGNCAYASALEQKADLQTAIDKLGEAIVRYRETLEADPNDMDARANIERAQLLIKDLIDKEKQRQEQEKQNQEDQEKQDQSTKPSEDQQSCSQPSQPESQPSPEDQEKKDQQQDQQKQQGEQQDQQKQDDSQQTEQDKQDSQDAQQKEGKPEAAEPQSGDKDKDQQQQQQAVPATQQAMTPEEAQRLLQMIRDKEQQRRDEQIRQMRIIQVPVDKDW